jgi:serine/threonine-protein kinase HipA
MRKALIRINSLASGILEKTENGKYRFTYQPGYVGQPVSLSMPVLKTVYEYDRFPPFFEGLLPEGAMLEALLKKYKIDRNDYFSQLIQVGNDVVGAVSIEEIE